MLRGERAGATPLAVRVDVTDPTRPVVTVGGDLDFQTSGVLQDELARLVASEPTLVTVDMAGLRFIDSTGLAVIVHGWRVGHEAGTTLELRGTPPFLAAILEVTGVGDLLARPPARPGAAWGAADGAWETTG
ncbi:STAS domain-containing protein [Polymorphospora sp. NPDC050346]|uniref:STAS domain-containing protein n=1 Tax=Polymorphospora sp. NPDC050346 TaxID=3155780 RepID=UPI0033D67073